MGRSVSARKTPVHARFLPLWYQALTTEWGLRLQTDDTQRACEYLHKARRDAADPSLSPLSLHISPQRSGEIWIVRHLKKDPLNGTGSPTSGRSGPVLDIDIE